MLHNSINLEPSFRIINKLTKKHQHFYTLILWKTPSTICTFYSLNLRMSNLLNLLQRNERNSVMEHKNDTKIHTDNFEYMFYKTVKPLFNILFTFWIRAYCFYCVWPLPWQPLHKKTASWFCARFTKIFIW